MKKQATAFIGKITASMTHEITNVLATIKETSGLMADLLAQNPQIAFPHRERFVKNLDTIGRQINRGMEINERLNKFAHSMDEPRVSVEINALMNQVVFLMQRFAKLKYIQLTYHPIHPDSPIQMNLFGVQMILCTCIEYCLARMVDRGRITLGSRRNHETLTFQLLTEPRWSPTEDLDALSGELAGVEVVLRRLHAHLPLPSTPPQQGLEIVFPLKSI